MSVRSSRKRNSPRQAGCHSKDNRFASRELAEQWIEKRTAQTGMSPLSWNVYGCRYAPPGRPHYHAGHIPGFIPNYGRMPAPERIPGRNRKRRHSR